MNEQSIRAWIKVAKKLIRENKRKQIKEQQHPITKYFPRLTSTSQSSTPLVPNQSTEVRNRPSIDDNTIQLNMDKCSITTVLKSPQQHIDTSSIAIISRPPFTNSVNSASAYSNQHAAHPKDKCASTKLSKHNHQIELEGNKQLQLEDISNPARHTSNCEGNYIHSNALDSIYNATPKKKFELPFSAHTEQILTPTEDELNQKQKPFKPIILSQALGDCKDQHNQPVSDTSKALSPETAACNNKLDQSNSESLNRNAHQTLVFFKRISTKTTPNKSNRNDNDILRAVSRNTTNIHQGKTQMHRTRE